MFWLFLILLAIFMFIVQTAVFFAWAKILHFENISVKKIIYYSILVALWQGMISLLSILYTHHGPFSLLGFVGILGISYMLFKNATEKKWRIYIFPILSILSIVCVSFFIIAILRAFFFTPFYIQGHAMEPNFSNGDYLIIKKSKLDIAHGDVIIFKYTNPENQQTSKLIKRVIGLPGEHIVINTEEIFIDDILLTEEKADYYYYGLSTSGTIDIILASDEYFVLGDNRDESFDSRAFGPIKKSQIVGEYWMKQTDLWNVLKKTQE